MTEKNGLHFYQIHNGVLESKILSPGAKVTYAILNKGEHYAEEHKTLKNGYFRLTRAYIASKLNKSKRMVSDYLKELADAGIIERKTVHDYYNGFSTREVFRINWKVVKALEYDDTTPEETEKPIVLYEEIKTRQDLSVEETSLKHEEPSEPSIYVESPDEEPDWCGRIPDDIDYQDWFEVKPPPGWSDDIVDPGEPPDWCGQSPSSDGCQDSYKTNIKKPPTSNNLPRGWAYIRGSQCPDTTFHQITD